MTHDDPYSMIKYLKEVQKLSFRQIASQTHIPRKKCSKIYSRGSAKIAPPKNSCRLESSRALILNWYQQQPDIRVTQIYERLIQRGIKISYPSVTLFTKALRPTKNHRAYFPLHFMPAEEGQVDWFFVNHPKLGMLSGFDLILSYSRYLYAELFLRNSFEFFIQGHLNAFSFFNGLPFNLRYDNLKSVVLKRTPLQLNPAFLEFAHHFRFVIRVCNPASGNGKGRVERVIRSMRDTFFNLNTEDCTLEAINLGLRNWIIHKNNTQHRSTQKIPSEMLKEESLKALPQTPWHNVLVHEPKTVSKTADITFDTNQYSVPESFVRKSICLHSTPTEVKL